MENTEQIIRIIGKNSDYKGEILPGDDLQNDLHLDSFDLLMIVNAIEDKYKINVEGEDMESIFTVSDLVRKLNQLTNDKSPGHGKSHF